MNKQRSPVEQMILFALMSMCAFMLYQQFYGNNTKKGDVAPAKPAPALALAFDRIGAGSGAPLSETQALAQIKTLQATVTANGSDDSSYWSRLRIGLLQQYILKDDVAAGKTYDEVIKRHKFEDIDAQAMYQKGDLFYRLSKPNAKTAMTPDQQSKLESQGAYDLEQIPVRARGHQDFLTKQIWVQDTTAARGNPMALPNKWEQMPLQNLLGIIPGGDSAQTSGGSGDPRLILPRVDDHYSKSTLYKIFDTVVKWFGANPAFSYGLALITLALITRLLMQPLIKKQYDSMKGMQIIAPEMKKIQEKYKGKTDQDAQMRMMKEIRALQKEHGVNPMGCGLSLVIQMPIFFFFVLPLINHSQAKMELVHAHFGWIKSLAHPDIPLLVLYAISMFVSVRLSSTPPADEQQRQMQKMTTFMSPLFALVLWSYPSAFILYWITYNMLSTALQWRMMKASDPDKNVWKTLLAGIGEPATGGAVTTATGAKTVALPPRPVKEGRVKTLQPGPVNAGEESQNGSAATQLLPSEDEGEDSEEAPLKTYSSSGAGNANGSNSGASRRRRRRK